MDTAPRKRAPRVSAEEVSELLIETVIDLVLTTPIEEIAARSSQSRRHWGKSSMHSQGRVRTPTAGLAWSEGADLARSRLPPSFNVLRDEFVLVVTHEACLLAPRAKNHGTTKRYKHKGNSKWRVHV